MNGDVWHELNLIYYWNFRWMLPTLRIYLSKPSNIPMMRYKLRFRQRIWPGKLTEDLEAKTETWLFTQRALWNPHTKTMWAYGHRQSPFLSWLHLIWWQKTLGAFTSWLFFVVFWFLGGFFFTTYENLLQQEIEQDPWKGIRQEGFGNGNALS